MKYATIILVLMLSACATSVPVTAKFPDVPDRLQVICPNLQKLPDDTKLSEVNKIIVKNYTTYYECAVKVDAWIEWYNIQKHIWNEIK